MTSRPPTVAPLIQFDELAPDVLQVCGLLDEATCGQVIEVADCFGYGQANLKLGIRDDQIRNNSLLYLGDDHGLLTSTQELLQAKIQVLKDMVYDYYGIRFRHNEACSILKYEPGQYYLRHIDNMLLSGRLEEAQKGVPTRDIGILGYLNQAFEGGETYFDRQDLKVKPQVGSVIVFPAGYTHPHQSLPVVSGVKYAFNCWLFH